MKRLISVCLAIIIALSSVAFTAFAEERTRTDALMEKIRNADSISIKVGLGGTSETLTLKGNRFADDFRLLNFIRMRILLAGDKVYFYLPALPFVYAAYDYEDIFLDDEDTDPEYRDLLAEYYGKITAREIIEAEYDTTLSGITYLRTYDETFDGKTYVVEEYEREDSNKLRFYYIGSELRHFCICKSEDGTTYSHRDFDGISFDVPDRMVAIPFGIDATPLFDKLLA